MNNSLQNTQTSIGVMLDGTNNLPASMAERIENQLAQVIIYIGTIDSLSEVYRANEKLRADAFLFHTVYDSLWDAAIVRIGTLWDNTKGVASLPKLAKHLRSLKNKDANKVANNIDKITTSELARIKEWRNAVVSHIRFPLDAPSFDRDNAINIFDLRKEAERIENLLAKANACFGRSKIHFQVIKEDALTNARNSLERWIRGVT